MDRRAQKRRRPERAEPRPGKLRGTRERSAAPSARRAARAGRERCRERGASRAGATGRAMDGPRLLLLQLLLLGVSLGGAKEACSSGLYTHGGECCKACNLGEGVAQPCGANQTVCEPCLDSVTFSDVVSATEPCKPCTECVGLQSMSAPCVEADDAVCRCAYGYYQDEVTGRCEACSVCEAGSGLVYSCQDKQNTVCEECPDGTYSDEANHVDPCLPCTVCEDTERQLRECTRWADAECEEIPGRWITRSTPPEGADGTVPGTQEPEAPPEQDIVASTVADVVTTVMGSSQPVVTRGTADDLIPIYCSILAAVVVGLVAYIVFKRWNSCKQNKQGANSRPANQTPPPEGEKLHSDSGISVDSQSLHDQQSHTQTAQGQALKGDSGLYSSLPPAKREEVEKLLNGSAGDTWRHLAGELGYQPEHIDSFTREACPTRAMLSTWAAQDSATLDALLAALRRIQRADIVESLCSESTATSPV
nr:tumor necrosis factor receptor superfamily member 16 [Cavia porcellus]